MQKPERFRGSYSVPNQSRTALSWEGGTLFLMPTPPAAKPSRAKASKGTAPKQWLLRRVQIRGRRSTTVGFPTMARVAQRHTVEASAQIVPVTLGRDWCSGICIGQFNISSVRVH